MRSLPRMNLTFSVIGASLPALADLKEILVGPPVQARKEMRTWAGERLRHEALRPRRRQRGRRRHLTTVLLPHTASVGSARLLGTEEPADDGLAEWITELPGAEKDTLLTMVADGEGAQVQALLLRRGSDTGTAGRSGSVRIATGLRAAAERRAAERKKAQEQRRRGLHAKRVHRVALSGPAAGCGSSARPPAEPVSSSPTLGRRRTTTVVRRRPSATPDCARCPMRPSIEADQLPGPCTVRFLPREPLTGLERRRLERGRGGSSSPSASSHTAISGCWLLVDVVVADGEPG